MTCSASSNILGSSYITNPISTNSRLILTLNPTSTYYVLEAGITNGDAIRFEPTPFGTTGTYKKSQANNNENAEVVGVVESVDNSGVLTVVLRGMMSHPTTNFSYSADIYGSTLGASGGNDIFFLSGSTAGGFQNLAPTEPGSIAKPVLQRIADTSGTYNYQVLNYIGYQIGGDLIAETQSNLPIGSFVKIPSNSIIPNGWVNTNDGTALKVSLYPDFYSFTGRSFGYIEEVYVKNAQVTASMVGATVVQNFQGTTISVGVVSSVNTSSNILYVKKASSQPIFDITSITVNLSSPVTFGISSTSVDSVYPPRVVDNSPITFYEQGSTTPIEVNQTFKTIIKVRDVTGVSIPKNVDVNNMTVLDTLALGNTYSNVSTTLDNVISRIQTLESQINGAS